MTQEGAAVGQVRHRSEEGEPTGVVQRDQPGQEQPAEQLAEHADREEEGRARRYPALPVERDAAARHDHVDMGMVGHRGAPCVEYGGDADARAEVLWIRRDRQHRLRCRAEQQVIDRRLVLEGDVGDLGGQREHDMEVADRQQVGLPLGEPCTRGRALALRDSAGCGSCCRRSANARSPRRPRRGRQAPRCGTVRSPTSPSADAGSDGRHGRPGIRGRRCGRCLRPRQRRARLSRRARSLPS